MKTTNNHKEQLEIAFTHTSFTVTPVIRSKRTRRMERARWWFRRMHEAVNHALDWSPTPNARPEQICLTLTQGKQV